MFAIQIITCGKGKIKQEKSKEEKRLNLEKLDEKTLFLEIMEGKSRKKSEKEWLHFYMSLIKKKLYIYQTC